MEDSKTKSNLISITEKANDMPMLQKIFDEFIESSKIALLSYLSTSVDMSLNTVMQIDSSEYSSTLKGNTEYIAIEYSFTGWNVESFYITLQKNLIYKMIEIIFGGKNIDHSLEVQNRRFSKIEKSIIDEILNIFTLNLNSAFLSIDNSIKLSQKRVYYDGCDYSQLKDNIVFLARSELNVKNIIGKIDVVLPYDVLLPMKTALMKSFSNKRLLQQESWKHHIQRSILTTKLQVTIEVEVIKTLNEIQKMKVGDTIITERSSTETFDLNVNGLKVYNCRVGKLSDKLAVEVITEK